MSTNPASARSRRPAGTPTGGQFAPEAHAEPEVALGNPPPWPESTPETRGNGDILWFTAEGQLHRTDGPAVEFADGRRQWWVDGEHLTEEEFYGRAVLHEPLTPDQIRARMDDDGYVAGLVPMDLDDTTDGLESTLDALSERLVGSGLLMDIDYRPVAVTRDGTIIVRVAGDPSMVLSDADD